MLIKSMRHLLGSLAVVCLVSCTLASEAHSKRRLIHLRTLPVDRETSTEPNDGHVNTHARHLNDADVQNNNNNSKNGPASEDQSETERRSGHDRHEFAASKSEPAPPPAAENSGEGNHGNGSHDNDNHGLATSRSTVIPSSRRLRNKKGSNRRNNKNTNSVSNNGGGGVGVSMISNSGVSNYNKDEKTTRDTTAASPSPSDNGTKHKSNSNRSMKKKLISNSKLLHRLGMVTQPNKNHYRKRLAGGGGGIGLGLSSAGQQKNGDLIGGNYKGHQKRILENIDSRMYVIKLPPSSYYYASHHEADKFRFQDPNQIQKYNLNNLGMKFNSNGKPSKIYHYNIPIINKVVGRKTNSNFYKYDDDLDNDAFLNGASSMSSGESSIYNVQTLESQASNELGGGGLGSISSSSSLASIPSSSSDQQQSQLAQTQSQQLESSMIKSNHRKPSYGTKKTAVTYMKPKPVKQTFMKYFPSNGKPHAFYIIENSSAPYYHRLLP